MVRNPLRVIWTDVQGSTAIARIGYSVALQEMRCVFFNREEYGEYIFGGMPEEMVIGWLTARSKGGFYHDYIRNNKRYTVSRQLGSYKLGALGRRVGNAGRAVRRAVRGAKRKIGL